MSREVIVIGSGLGGLICGLLLARRGYHVTVLEQSARIGGCLQSFRRKSYVFDTGLHFVGGLEEGGRIRDRFEELGLLDLPWEILDGEEVVVGKDGFFLPSGYEECKYALSAYFPASSDEIASYLDDLASVASGEEPAMDASAYAFLCSHISDPLLRKVLSGTSFKMELDAESLPLGVFARINDSFFRGIRRLCGGGSRIAEVLAGQIMDLGGVVLTGKRVDGLEISDGRVQSVMASDGMSYDADIVVSDVHPSRLMDMCGDGIRKVYRNRIKSLRNTRGISTINIGLGENAPRRENRSLFIHSSGADLWKPRTDVLESVCVSFGDGTLDLMTRWNPSDRENLTEACIDMVSGRLPWLRDCAKDIYVSTPDTYFRYTGTPDGSAYGILRDCNDTMMTMLSARTPLRNLFLTGQNLGIHGIMGVTETAFRTCETID